MDMHGTFLNRQKANMSSYIPQPCGSEFFPSFLYFGNQSPTCHSFNKGNGYNMPHKSFSYPNCIGNMKVSPEKFINKAMNFTQGIYNYDRCVPTVRLSYFVGSSMDHKQTEKSSIRHTNTFFDNPMESMFKNLVSKSIEISRTMSCPDPFNFCDFSPSKGSTREGMKTEFISPVNSVPEVKMTYADVAKMNLSNLQKNLISPNKQVVYNLSSHKPNVYGKKECKVISPPCQVKNSLHSSNSDSRNVGTNNFIKTSKDFVKPKIQNLGKSSNSRRPQNRRIHCSLKRELGTKKNNQQFDFDGSMWSNEISDIDMFEDCVVCSPSGPSIILRVRSISSESDCSSEQSDILKNPRVRSISECSINSVDSDDSFIVFDECVEDNTTDGSCDEESSDGDECLSVVDYYSESPQEKWLACVDAKSLSNVTLPIETAACSTSPCAALKKVRFACGEALAKVRKLCVWNYAHRTARVGPWEQAARDRARFSARICTLAPIINPILDPAHRSKIYDLRFALS